MERYLRNAAGMPELGEDDLEKHRRMARKDEAARFAETELRYLSARSELAAAMAAEQAAAAGEMTPEQVAQQREMQMGQATADQQGEAHSMQMAQGAAALMTPPTTNGASNGTKRPAR